MDRETSIMHTKILRRGEHLHQSAENLLSDAGLKIDAALLQQVASGDQTAFAELFNRYKRIGYHLAFHITNNRTGAEEAIQEAMLRVWKSASNFKADGNPRGWIMRTISREALKWLRSKRRHQSNVELDEELDALPIQTGPTDTAERRELLSGIKSCLSQLPAGSQRLLTLYFLSGLTQTEIGKALSLSQRTVSFKIEEALKQIRGRLKKNGYAAALPLLATRHILEAFELDTNVPTGLSENLLQALNSSPAVQSGKGAWTASYLWLAVGGMALLAATTGLYVSGQLDIQFDPPAPTIVQIPTPTVQPPNPSQPKPPPTKLTEIIYQDEFESPRLDPFWIVGKDNENIVPASGKKKSELVLKVEGPKEGKARVTEIVSRPVLLGDLKSAVFKINTNSPTGMGRFDYGIQILDHTGKVIWHWVYQTERKAKNQKYSVLKQLHVGGVQPTSDEREVKRWNPPNIGLSLDLDPQPSNRKRSALAPPVLKENVKPNREGMELTEFSGPVADLEQISIRVFVVAYPNSHASFPVSDMYLERSTRGESK